MLSGSFRVTTTRGFFPNRHVRLKIPIAPLRSASIPLDKFLQAALTGLNETAASSQAAADFRHLSPLYQKAGPRQEAGPHQQAAGLPAPAGSFRAYAFCQLPHRGLDGRMHGAWFPAGEILAKDGPQTTSGLPVPNSSAC